MGIVLNLAIGPWQPGDVAVWARVLELPSDSAGRIFSFYTRLLL